MLSVCIDNRCTVIYNVHMAFDISFSEEKNQLLKVTRGVSFEQIKDLLGTASLLADIIHPSKRYLHQRVYVLRINGYVYAVPYVINLKKNEIFLKTAYPSRTYTVNT